MFWGHQISRGRKGPPKFLTEFYKSWSSTNIWQSLVMIGQVTSEIKRQKKKEDLNYSGKTEWLAASTIINNNIMIYNPSHHRLLLYPPKWLQNFLTCTNRFFCETAYMLSAHMLSQFRLSVRLSVRSSVCHMGGSVKNG